MYLAAAGDLINNWEYRGKTAKFTLVKRETSSAAEISFRNRYYNLCLFPSAGYDIIYPCRFKQRSSTDMHNLSVEFLGFPSAVRKPFDVYSLFNVVIIFVGKTTLCAFASVETVHCYLQFERSNICKIRKCCRRRKRSGSGAFSDT